jgi:hypothetical protein
MERFKDIAFLSLARISASDIGNGFNNTSHRKSMFFNLKTTVFGLKLRLGMKGAA